MTGTDLAVREQQTNLATVLTNEQLKFIANSEFVPKGLRGNLPAILACVATGRAIGIDDMSAIRSIHIIDGKATFSAELMVMLVRRRGHSIVGEVTGESATVTGKRADNGDEMRVTWTLEMAKRAGLTGKGNWKSYPEAMLWARAVSQLARMLFADCFAGSTYTTEELGEEHTDSAREPEADAPPPRGDVAVSQAASEPASPADVVGGRGVSEAAAAPGSSWFPPADAPEPGMGDAPDVVLATKAQQTLILIKADQAGLDEDARHALIESVTGQPSSKLVPKALVDAVLAAIAAHGEGASEFRVPDSVQQQIGGAA